MRRMAPNSSCFTSGRRGESFPDRPAAQRRQCDYRLHSHQQLAHSEWLPKNLALPCPELALSGSQRPLIRRVHDDGEGSGRRYLAQQTDEIPARFISLQMEIYDHEIRPVRVDVPLRLARRLTPNRRVPCAAKHFVTDRERGRIMINNQNQGDRSLHRRPSYRLPLSRRACRHSHPIGHG